ncbi:transcriptional regulator [Lactobacillus rossiae]|uniref:Transcriptional regulator n=2 Tax=Furfurilactobacillus milii TaxID=2888272 RepID=A0A6N9I514_9LACO|nr:transcriptional regulator [Furfurilactobacillus milii]
MEMNIMIKIYTIPSNLPSRQAVRWLTQHDVAFAEQRVHVDQPELTIDELKQFLMASENGVDDLLSFQSLAYAAFIKNHDPEAMSLQALLTAMIANIRLLHFPIIYDEHLHILQTGFSQDDIRVFLPRSVRVQELTTMLLRESKSDDLSDIE